jgi:site-specific recombinase XerD
MGMVFKRPGSNYYYIRYTDYRGKTVTRSSRTAVKEVAEKIMRKREADHALRREGVIDPRIEEAKRAAEESIDSALKSYRDKLRAKGTGLGHIDATENQIRSICTVKGITKLGEITEEKVNAFLSGLIDKDRSARTIGSYAQSIKGFTRWAAKAGKLQTNPLQNVTKPSSESDRRLVRRYLSHDEWSWLEHATKLSPLRFNMPGRERSALYALAIQTGLRSGELRSLTRGKLNLTAKPPFVLAAANSTKNKKQARQYIQPELAAELLELVEHKKAGDPVFALPHESTIVDMIREDIDRARKCWLDTIEDNQARIEAEESDFLRVLNSEGEKLDFHALRHTTATWLIASGADVKSVQSVMRHSNIKLTLDRYGHLFPGAEADAVSRLRDVFANAKKVPAKAKTAEPTVHHTVHSLQVTPCASLRFYGFLKDGRLVAKSRKKPCVSQGFTKEKQGFSQVRVLGLEPRTNGLKVRCSTD